MDFGEWDYAKVGLKTVADLEGQSLRVDRTVFYFYDFWRVTALAVAGFASLHLIEWLKTSSVPLNSKRN